MSSISFDNIWLLFLAIPLAAVLIVPTVFAIRRDNRNGHNIASLVLHVVMAALITLAAADMKIVHVVTETEIYAVADVSYSARHNLDTVDEYIANIKAEMPRKAKLGVVCFGKDAQVLTRAGKRIRSVSSSDVDYTETNIVEALEYTVTLFREGTIKHIVLITDGRQSYHSDASALKRTVANLDTQGIHVDAMYLNDALGDDTPEFQISGVEYAREVYKDSERQANVLLQSNYAATVSYTLYCGDEVVQYPRDTADGRVSYPKLINLTAGATTLKLPLLTEEGGEYAYRVEINEATGGEPSRDGNAFNNMYTFTQKVCDERHVMLVTEKWSDLKGIVALYGAETYVDAYIHDATVSAAERDAFAAAYERLTIKPESAELPANVEDMCVYDEFVLSSVDLTEFSPYGYEYFIACLDTAVSSCGKSLVTYGDLAIQDKRKELARLDNILPVQYGDADDKPQLFTFVLDVSYSMGMASRLSLEKAAVKEIVSKLDEKDYVYIVRFWGSAQEVGLYSLKNKAQIYADVDALQMGNGTLVSRGMRLAQEQIVGLSGFSRKQVMVITDGLPYEGSLGGEEGDNDRSRCYRIAEELLSMRIRTSVVAVGGLNDDRAWMQQLAEQHGNGRYYLVTNKDLLVQIGFATDNDEGGDLVVTDYTWVEPEAPDDPMLQFPAHTEGEAPFEIGSGALANVYVRKYVVSTRKSAATTVLTVDYATKSGTYIPVPLLAYRRYTDGKVVTYTGDFGALYCRGDLSDYGETLNRDLFSNIIAYALPDEKSVAPYRTDVQWENKSVTLSLTPATRNRESEAYVTVISPDGTREEGRCVPGELGSTDAEFVYTFAARQVGTYELQVRYAYGEGTYDTSITVDMPYEPEYDAFASFDPSILYKMTDGNGTVSEDGRLKVRHDESEAESYTFRVAFTFAVVSVVLFVIDIIIRKLKWSDIVSLFGGARRNRGKGGAK